MAIAKWSGPFYDMRDNGPMQERPLLRLGCLQILLRYL